MTRSLTVVSAGLLLERRLRRILAGAGYGLVGRDDNARDGRRVMQGFERDDELRGRRGNLIIDIDDGDYLFFYLKL